MPSLNDLDNSAIRLLSLCAQLDPDMYVMKYKKEAMGQLMIEGLLESTLQKEGMGIRLSLRGWQFFTEHCIPSCSRPSKVKCSGEPSKECPWCKKELPVHKTKLFLPKKYQ